MFLQNNILKNKITHIGKYEFKDFNCVSLKGHNRRSKKPFLYIYKSRNFLKLRQQKTLGMSKCVLNKKIGEKSVFSPYFTK